MIKNFSIKKSIKGLKRPTFKDSFKNGTAVLIIAIVAALVISLFDLGVSSIINLFI